MAQNWTDDTYGPTHTAESDLLNIESNFAAIKSAFSGSSAPTGPVAGQFWYKTDTDELKVYDGTQWRKIINTSTNKVANAESVDGFSASATPTADTLLVLNGSGRFPTSVVPAPGNTTPVVLDHDATSPWTVPDNCHQIWVTMVGGGGGGESSSGGSGRDNMGSSGGGAGGFTYNLPMAVTPGATIAFTVGARGLTQSNGGATTFNGVTVYGGSKGGMEYIDHGEGEGCWRTPGGAGGRADSPGFQGASGGDGAWANCGAAHAENQKGSDSLFFAGGAEGAGGGSNSHGGGGGASVFAGGGYGGDHQVSIAEAGVKGSGGGGGGGYRSGAAGGYGHIELRYYS